MKLIILIVILGLAFAAAESAQPKFRNLYQTVQGDFRDHGRIGGRIINGEVAQPHSIPYQAFLVVTKDDGSWYWYCGGSLITPNVVLTAGHCAFEASVARVVLGAQNPLVDESTQVVINSTKFIVHEDFNLTLILNDIALIILPHAVELNTNINIAKLPPKGSSDSYAGMIGKVSGWGMTDGHGSDVPETLMFTQNPILNNNECSVFFPTVEDYQVCMSGQGGRSGCNGDSGGPFTVDDVLIGLVSYGSRNCPKGSPSVFTRTTSFLDWIEKHAA